MLSSKPDDRLHEWTRPLPLLLPPLTCLIPLKQSPLVNLYSLVLPLLESNCLPLFADRDAETAATRVAVMIMRVNPTSGNGVAEENCGVNTGAGTMQGAVLVVVHYPSLYQ